MMRRILIAVLLGAPLLIASPAVAAIAGSKTPTSGSERSGVAGGLAHGELARDTLADLVPNEAPAARAVQLAGDANALWWLQLGVGNRWHDSHRHRDHRHRDWHKHDRWHHNHGAHRGHRRWHQEGHRHRDWRGDRGRDDDRRWRRRDWDDDDDHRHRGRHGRYDDNDRGYRWADGRYHR